MWVAGCLWHPLSVALSRSLGRLQRQTNKIEKQLEWADQERTKEGWISSLWMAGGLLICSTNQSWPTLDTNICPSPHFNSLAAQLWTLGRCNCWIWQKKVFHLVKMSMTKNLHPSKVWLRCSPYMHTGTWYLPNHPSNQNKWWDEKPSLQYITAPCRRVKTLELNYEQKTCG